MEIKGLNENDISEKNKEALQSEIWQEAAKEMKTENGEVSEAERTEDEEAAAVAKAENAKSVKERAKEKLEKEMKADKNKSFAEPVIGYLLKRCEEDAGLAQDVVQEHKSWDKCIRYLYNQAEKQIPKEDKKGIVPVPVSKDAVFEWAEDYYHKDDKAEEEKKAKEAAERKKKEEERKKKAAEQKKADKKNPKKAAKKEKMTEEKPVKPPKPKKNTKEMDGQLDMFSMMGM